LGLPGVVKDGLEDLGEALKEGGMGEGGRSEVRFDANEGRNTINKDKVVWLAYVQGKSA
jgi:hypothetical protein